MITETINREGHRTEKGFKDVPNLSENLSDSSSYLNQGIQSNKTPEKEKEPSGLIKTTGEENNSQRESQNKTEEGQDENKNRQIELNEYEILDGLKSKGVLYFSDQNGNPFVWILKWEGDKSVCMNANSKGFKTFLFKYIQVELKGKASPRMIQNAIKIVEFNCFAGDIINLSLRYSSEKGNIYIDLRDDKGTVIELSKNGWKKINLSAPCFYSTTNQQEISISKYKGDIYKIFDFIPDLTEDEKILFIVWLLSAMIPFIPTPILIMVGPQGSAKTTRTKYIRRLLDPDQIQVLGEFTKDALSQIFHHHAVPCFENVSNFNRSIADTFCRAVTGAGIERRKLYTDSDPHTLWSQRPIVINGISVPSTRPDFLDRCLIFNCKRMNSFKNLKTLDEKFESIRPKIFRALLDLLVETLCQHPSTPPATQFRMADFATLGRAVCKSLGKKYEDFDNAYMDKIKDQNAEILEDNPVIRLLKQFVSSRSISQPWEGTADELLTQLTSLAKVTKDHLAMKALPKSARWLSTSLGELSQVIATQGIHLEKMPRKCSQRLWKITHNHQSEVSKVTKVLENDEKGGDSNE